MSTPVSPAPESGEDKTPELRIEGDVLCQVVDHCTCGVGNGPAPYGHEPGCGLEPVMPVRMLHRLLDLHKLFSPGTPGGGER